MENDFTLRSRYLDQYKDIYGDNVYLSSIDLVKDKINTIKGGTELTAFYHLIKDCGDCEHINPKIDFGSGNANANIIFITESKIQENNENFSSLTSDEHQLIDKILSAINLAREDIYFSNILKYTSDKDSYSTEIGIQICEFHFQKHLELINPTLVVAFGKDVGNKLLKIDESIENLNSKIHIIGNFKLMVTYHPKTILKNPKLKQAIWQDFKNIRDNYLD